MLRDAAVDLLMNRLGQRTGTTLKDQIIGEMVFVQENLLEGNATQFWFTVQDSVGLVTAADTETVALPTDFMQEWEEGALYITETAGTKKEVKKADWDSIAIHTSLLSTGLPEFYSIDTTNISLRKIPDIVYTLDMKYHAKQASLAGVTGDAANVENGWLEHASDWLIGETGTIIASQYLQSETMVKVFAAQAKMALDRLIKKNTAWEEANKTRMMDA